MANITLSNLNPVGSDLFSDSESFMHDLSNSETNLVNGGLSPLLVVAGAVLLAGCADGCAHGTASKSYNCPKYPGQ